MYKISPKFFEVFKRDLEEKGGAVEASAEFVKNFKQDNLDIFKWLIQKVYKEELSEVKGHTLFSLLIGFYIGFTMLKSMAQSEIMDLEDLYADCDKKTRDHVRYAEFLEEIISELSETIESNPEKKEVNSDEHIAD